jgi:HEAT repeat protein
VIAYLNHFGWESLSTITDLLGILDHRPHREAICSYLVDRGRDRVDIISKGIFDRRWFVVRNTAAILAEIGTEEVAPYLEKAIAHTDPRVRYQVALGLCRKVSAENIELLFKLVWDNDERVRQTTLDTILGLPDDIRLKTIVNIINDDRFATLSESNQERIIMLLSVLGGEHAVGYLTSLITSGGLFRSQIKDFYQQVAFNALARNMSEKAERVLLKFNRSWRRRLRRMAGDALRARREIKYSGVK